MGINSEINIEADLRIGPTDKGMVRIYVEAGKCRIPMDFEPEEAKEIAEEICAAARVAGCAEPGDIAVTKAGSPRKSST